MGTAKKIAGDDRQEGLRTTFRAAKWIGMPPAGIGPVCVKTCCEPVFGQELPVEPRINLIPIRQLSNALASEGKSMAHFHSGHFESALAV
jgi:hypothetical protein